MPKTPNDLQRQAIESTNKKLGVLSGPGTGKTFVLVERLKWLLANTDLEPSDIAVLTFTRSAAKEVRERIGDAADEMYIGTTHALMYLLRGGSESVIADDAAITMAKQLTKKRSATKLERDWLSGEPRRYEENQIVGKVLKKGNVITYSQLWSSLDGMDSGQYRCVLFDEAQDADLHEERLVRTLAPDWLFVVGDPNQAIFDWRPDSGGDMWSMCEATVPLTRSYRCPRDAAIIASRALGQHKPVFTKSNGDGKVVECDDLRDPGGHYEAVLVRTNAEGRQMEQILTQLTDKEHRFCSRRDGVWDSPQMQSVHVVCTAVTGQHSKALDESLRACVSAAGTDKKQRDLLAGEAAEGIYLTEALQKRGDLTTLSSAADVWDQVTKLVSGGVTMPSKLKGVSVGEFVEWYPDRDLEIPDGVIPILTIHTAKGREWDRVYYPTLVGKRMAWDEEERRVWFVALTRWSKVAYLPRGYMEHIANCSGAKT